MPIFSHNVKKVIDYHLDQEDTGPPIATNGEVFPWDRIRSIIWSKYVTRLKVPLLSLNTEFGF